jgi:diacylglycerol kinase family enzyme
MLHRHPNVEHRDGVTAATITGVEPFPYQVDGDYLGEVNQLQDSRITTDVLTVVVPECGSRHACQRRPWR